nr:hypothetical protein MN210_04570 [Psychrobacter sp. PraFG1]
MIKKYMSAMGVEESLYQNGNFEVKTPIDGSVIGKVTLHEVSDVETQVSNAKKPLKNGVLYLLLKEGVNSFIG